MDFAVGKFAVLRSCSAFVLAVLLLLTPMCGAICQAQMCSPPQAGAEKSVCHESFGGAADSSDIHISSMQNCTLQQLLVALPASFRSVSGDSPLFAHAERNASPPASFGFEFLQGTNTHLLSSRSGEARSLSHFSELSPLVLRI